MTTARAAAPNLGGRANTRSRAEVASYYLSWTAVPHSDCRPLTVRKHTLLSRLLKGEGVLGE